MFRKVVKFKAASNLINRNKPQPNPPPPTNTITTTTNTNPGSIPQQQQQQQQQIPVSGPIPGSVPPQTNSYSNSQLCANNQQHHLSDKIYNINGISYRVCTNCSYYQRLN
jgi:hypothetical protein